MKNNEWIIPSVPDDIVNELSRTCDILPAVARVLYNRGYTDALGIKAFLSKSNERFHDPFLLTDMDRAVERLEQALKSGERITIYGDYDVDGITSTTVLYTYLKQYTDNIFTYIPDRLKEGYGLSEAGVKKICSDTTRLMITVDTGITALSEIAYVCEHGVDVIVTDHHECSDSLPQCSAVVDPRRQGDKYPFKALAGVGVAFKLVQAHAIYRATSRTYIAQGDSDTLISVTSRISAMLADIVALGTVADVVPLLDENRLIVTVGLHIMKSTNNTGLAALLEMCRLGGNISSESVAFNLAPKINAAGRMGDVGVALRLFLCDGSSEAYGLAQQLCDRNTERREEEAQIYGDVMSMIASRPQLLEHNMIVLGKCGWHRGIVGIVCSRMTECFGLPIILVSFEDGVGHGSGRSTGGFDMHKALCSSSQYLIKYGGHKSAAGLTVDEEHFDEFAESIIKYADAVTLDTSVKINTDTQLEHGEITYALAEQLSLLEPCGEGNPTPLFVARSLRLIRTVPIGGGKHLKLTFRLDNEACIQGLYFGQTPLALPVSDGDMCDVIFELSLSEFRGQQQLQLMIKDIRQVQDEHEHTARELEIYDNITARRLKPRAEDIPIRADIARVFNALKNCCGDSECVLNALRISSLSSLGLVKTLLCCDILSQLELIGMTKHTPLKAGISMREVKEKKELERSELFVYLRSCNE